MFTGVGLPLRGGARMAGMSRMSREAHVRICGGLEVKFLRSTRPADSGPLESRILAEIMAASPLRIQPIDATHSLNFSAGEWG